MRKRAGKRFLNTMMAVGLTLSICLGFGMKEVKAAEPTDENQVMPQEAGGLQITDTGLDLSVDTPKRAVDYTAGTGTVHWEPKVVGDVVTGGTLTLNNAQVTNASGSAIALPDIPVEVVLNGRNTLNCTGTTDSLAGDLIESANCITVSGSGNLSGSSARGHGIASVPMNALAGDGNLILKGSGIIDIQAYSQCLYTQYGDISIQSGTVKVQANSTSGHGVYIHDGNIRISGGDVTATGVGGYGLYASGNDTDSSVTITGGTVSANGNTASGFGIAAGSVPANAHSYTVNISGTADVTSTGAASIYANDKVSINGGKVTATALTSGYPGIRSTRKNVEVDGSAQVAVSSKIAGFFADAGAVILGGSSNTTITGDAYGVYSKISDIQVKDSAVVTGTCGTRVFHAAPNMEGYTMLKSIMVNTEATAENAAEWDGQTELTAYKYVGTMVKSANAGITAVTIGGVEQSVTGTETTITLPAGSALPTDISQLGISFADGNARISSAVPENGGRLWRITVMAEDGVTTQEYIIHVNVTAAESGTNGQNGNEGTTNKTGDNQSNSMKDSKKVKAVQTGDDLPIGFLILAVAVSGAVVVWSRKKQINGNRL